MHKYRNIILLLLLAVSSISCSQNKIYFDADWKETTKENASFYRILSKTNTDLWLLEDYYISGEKQFKGQAKDSLGTIYEGDIVWYFKTGKVQNKIRYKDGKKIGLFTIYEGAIGSSEEGWNEKDLYFSENSGAATAANASGGKSITIYEYFYENSNQLAYQYTNKIGYKGEGSFTIYFNKKGDTIGRLDYSYMSDKWQGKDISFYEIDKRGKDDIVSIKEINSYKEGVIVETTYYDLKENVLAEGVFKNEKPYNGSFVTDDDCSFNKVQHYSNGVLNKEIAYAYDRAIIGVLSYKNGKPLTGILYSCNGFKTYKNGKLHGESVVFYDEEREQISSRINYKKGLKHGDYLINNDVDTPLEIGTYKNGVLNGDVRYYHHLDYHSASETLPYYLKINVTSLNNKPHVFEITKFVFNEDTLLETYKLESNTTDKFSYLKSGNHKIKIVDINSDGFEDLQITNYSFEHDAQESTTYLYTDKSKQYQHIPELDNADEIEINTEDNTVLVTESKFKDQTSYTTYTFIKTKPVAQKVSEEIYHKDLDSTIVTQVFPVDIDKHPLLDTNLPSIQFVQQNNILSITEKHTTVKLKPSTFKISGPATGNKVEGSKINLKVTVSDTRAIFSKVNVNTIVDDIPFFGWGDTFAKYPNKPNLIIDDEGNTGFDYDPNAKGTLQVTKEINQNIMLLEATIKDISRDGENMAFTSIQKPLYMVIFLDKNENHKIDENEVFKVTLMFDDK